jgi:hypothetical protein
VGDGGGVLRKEAGQLFRGGQPSQLPEQLRPLQRVITALQPVQGGQEDECRLVVAGPEVAAGFLLPQPPQDFPPLMAVQDLVGPGLLGMRPYHQRRIVPLTPDVLRQFLQVSLLHDVGVGRMRAEILQRHHGQAGLLPQALILSRSPGPIL